MSEQEHQGRQQLGQASRGCLGQCRQRLEATSLRVVGGIRHVRREAALRQRQVGQALDELRRGAVRGLSRCLTTLQRPPSSAVAFAAMSTSHASQPFCSVALSRKQTRAAFNHVFVYYLGSVVDRSPIFMAPLDPDDKAVSFVFLDAEMADEMVADLSRTAPSVLQDAKMVAAPLGEFNDKYMIKERRRLKKHAFHFVPQPQEVYFAACIKKYQAMEAKEKEKEAENAAAQKSRLAESGDAQKELTDDDNGNLSTDDENGKLVIDEPANQDPIAEAPASQKSSPMEEAQSSSDESSLDKNGAEAFVEGEEFGEDVSDVTIQGVPVFVCKNLFVGKDHWVPHFLSFRDLDCFMRLSLVNTIEDNQLKCTNHAEWMNRHRKKALSEAKKKEGEEAQELLEQAEAASNEIIAVATQLAELPSTIMANLDIEVKSLESLLPMVRKENARKTGRTMLIPYDSVFPDYVEQLETQRHLDYLRRLQLVQGRPTIVPDYLLY